MISPLFGLLNISLACSCREVGVSWLGPGGRGGGRAIPSGKGGRGGALSSK